MTTGNVFVNQKWKNPFKPTNGYQYSQSDLLSPEVATYLRKGIVSLSELVHRKMNTSSENGDIFILFGNLSGTRKIDISHWLLYKPDWNVTRHVFELFRVIDLEGAISNYYEPAVRDGSLLPFENILPNYYVDFNIVAWIPVDKYQYIMSSERVADRLKDVDAMFSSSTVLNWVHRYI